MSESNPYEATKHLSDVNRHGWKGADLLPRESQYRTDGHMIVRCEAVEDERFDRRTYREVEWRDPTTEESADRVWSDATSGSLYVAHVERIIDVSSTSRWSRYYEVLAVLQSEDGNREPIYVNAHKLRLACYWTRPDAMKARAPNKGVVLYRDGEPVAVVMPVRETEAGRDIRATLENREEQPA